MELNLAEIDLSEKDLLSGRNIIPINSYFSFSQREEWKKYLNELTFKPLEHEGSIARYEACVENSFPLAKPFREHAIEFTKSVGLKNLSADFYAFRYETGNQVPWHKDRSRHKITLMGYFGDFSGGEYEYHNTSGCITTLTPKCGDVILVVNETASGQQINPLHRVCPISNGIRYTIVVSMVSTSALTEPFK